jgi:hypothetical protein
MNGSPASQEANLIVKFSDYEVYDLPVIVNSNTTLFQAVGSQYYVKLTNNSVECIRDACNGVEGNWLFFNANGYLVSMDQLVIGGDKFYLVYNKTQTTNETANIEAIKQLLKLQ